MKTILSDGELSEITIEESIKSNDSGKVILENKGERKKNLPEDRKEIIGLHALEVGATRAAEIHGVSVTSAQRYSNGQNVSEETKTKILDEKHQIRDVATTKLLQALHLIDPTNVEDKDLPRVASQLSQIVERLEDKGRGGNTVELHMYAPQQKKLESFKIIDV